MGISLKSLRQSATLALLAFAPQVLDLGVHVVANDDVFQNSFVFSAKTLRPFAMFALLDFTHAFTHAGFEWVAVALIFFRRAFLCSWQPDCFPGGVSLCIVPTCKVVICATQN